MPLFKSPISRMLTSAVLRWFRSPPMAGGHLVTWPPMAGGGNHLGRSSSRFWPLGRSNAWSLSNYRSIPGIPKEPLLTKGKKHVNSFPTPLIINMGLPFSSPLLFLLPLHILLTDLFLTFIFLTHLFHLTPSPEQVGRPPPQKPPPSSQETRTQ